MVDSGLGEKHSVHDKRPHTLECHWLQFERRSLDVEDSYMSVCVCGGRERRRGKSMKQKRKLGKEKETIERYNLREIEW